MTQPAAAPHGEKSTININSFFRRGNAEFLSILSIHRDEVTRVRNVLVMHSSGILPTILTIFALGSINHCEFRLHFQSGEFVKVGHHMWVTATLNAFFLFIN